MRTQQLLLHVVLYPSILAPLANLGAGGGGGAHTASLDIISCFQTHCCAHHQLLSRPSSLTPSWKLEQWELRAGQEEELFVWVPLHWMIADDNHIVLHYAQVTLPCPSF